ncbi:MAG TPA: SAM-dependent methyltransferase [Allosphingosinicella sp.]|nr:SAM-dependent methyltransferase [Allosphingosinicella sp.]
MTESRGRLIVVGTGLRTVGQMTTEAIAWIKAADSVLYVVGDPVAEEMILRLKPDAISLQTLYSTDSKRIDTYEMMVERVLESVRGNSTTCAVFYGHPGVFVYPSHAAIQRARAEGYPAVMLPGVSAEDCLFADIGIDPAETGCSSYEATDYLFHQRPTDPASAMVLWQIGILGNDGYNPGGRYETPLMPLLIHKLGRHYGQDHRVAVYEAAVQVGCLPRISWIPMAGLATVELTAASTLYIPPAAPSQPDHEMFAYAEAMGINLG